MDYVERLREWEERFLELLRARTAPPVPGDAAALKEALAAAEAVVKSAEAELQEEVRKLGLDPSARGTIPEEPEVTPAPLSADDPLASARQAVADAEASMREEIRRLGLDPEKALREAPPEPPEPEPPAPPEAPEDLVKWAQEQTSAAEKAVKDEVRRLGLDPDNLPEHPVPGP